MAGLGQQSAASCSMCEEHLLHATACTCHACSSRCAASGDRSTSCTTNAAQQRVKHGAWRQQPAVGCYSPQLATQMRSWPTSVTTAVEPMRAADDLNVRISSRSIVR